MYKCRLVYDEWKCMKSKNKREFIKTEDFVGYIGDLRIHEVSENKYGNIEIKISLFATISTDGYLLCRRMISTALQLC